MAKVSMKDNAPPQIGYPIGSVEELEALEVPRRNIRSCSEPEANRNGGCPVWDICDRAYRGDRPQNEIVRKVNRAGKIRIYQAPCFDTVPREAVAADNFESYEVIGHEGDEYTYKGSVKLHEHRNADCNDCAHGKCEKYVDRNNLKGLCMPFPPAAEHPELVMFAERVAARKSSGVKKRDAVKERLLPSSEEGKTVNVAKEEKPRFGHGSRS